MFLGELIKEYRNTHSLSMDKFAKLSGLSKSYISILEKNLNPTTGKEIEPTFNIMQKCAQAMNIDVNDLINMLDKNQPIQVNNFSEKKQGVKGIKIPVLGKVAAGIPIEAIEEIIDYEEITEEMAKKGDYFGLLISGNSMFPRICEGDVVIVKKQSDVEDNEIAIVMINGDNATCKKVKKTEQGLMLIPNNPSYETMFFTNEEIEKKPIKILGKVVELRAKF